MERCQQVEHETRHQFVECPECNRTVHLLNTNDPADCCCGHQVHLALNDPVALAKAARMMRPYVQRRRRDDEETSQ